MQPRCYQGSRGLGTEILLTIRDEGAGMKVTETGGRSDDTRFFDVAQPSLKGGCGVVGVSTACSQSPLMTTYNKVGASLSHEKKSRSFSN